VSDLLRLLVEQQHPENHPNVSIFIYQKAFSIVLYRVVLRCIAFIAFVSLCIALYLLVLPCIVLNRVASPCIVLYRLVSPHSDCKAIAL
jgi:hypothetical protein